MELNKTLRISRWIIFVISFILFTGCNDDDDIIVTCQNEEEQAFITEISPTRTSVYTHVVIDAPLEKVWQVLTDFEEMPNWSSTFQGLSGNIENDGVVTATFLFGNQNFEVSHRLIYEENSHFGWSEESNTYPGIYDNHIYKVESCGDQTLFIQSDEFTGENENIATVELAMTILEQYQIFNNELKTQLEL